jgi:hypothetical protein
MATGSTGLTGEMRAANRRHFSDRSYELLAHNVGLNIYTLHNWDFVNPNDVDAHSIELTLLSTASSLSISWWYNGTRSPWRDPTLASTGNTRNFQGTTYNEFILKFNVDKSWSGGADGIVPPGIEFHIGASFHEPNPVIVYDTKLKNNAGADLALHPRMIGFNTGALDLATGDFDITLFNPNPGLGELIIQNFTIQMLPRMADIATMVAGDSLRDVRGIPVLSHKDCTTRQSYELKDKKSIRISQLSDDRFVDLTYDSTKCKRGIVAIPGDMEGGEIIYCPDGNALSLFPSTTVYITATVIDPNARHFDPVSGNFVTGPLVSKVFYQFAGFVPDLNKNGIDDLIDIRNGTARDKNGNGVVDNMEPGQEPPHEGRPWWVYWILILLLIIIVLIQYFRRRKKG